MYRRPGFVQRAMLITDMDLHIRPDAEAKLRALASDTGRSADDLASDAINAYAEELMQLRSMLDSRYDDLESGSVKPIDREEARARLHEKIRQRTTRPT